MTDQKTQTPELLALLKKLEWAYSEFPDKDNKAFCPLCDCLKTQGHHPSCELAAAIAEASKPFDHRQRHVELHRCLDELIADFLAQTDKLPSNTTLLEFMKWSHQQTITPTE